MESPCYYVHQLFTLSVYNYANRKMILPFAKEIFLFDIGTLKYLLYFSVI